MTLDDVKKALLTVTSKVYHFSAPPNTSGSYIVWAEDGMVDDLSGDGEVQAQNIEGTIDYFTKNEYDATPNKIHNALNSARVGFRINSIQHEQDTGYIHYEWVFSIPIEVL